MTDAAQAGASNAAARIFLIATEESGDRLGGALMQALKKRTGGRIGFSGVGGHCMESEGIQSLFPIDQLAIVGIDAVVAKLPMILRRIRESAAAVTAANPDALVIIDSPDFTHRVARKVRAAAPHIRIVDYVSPSVWAWRPGRAKAMRRYVDHVLALLPFEPEAHARLGGPPCTYVGHPVTEIAGRLRPNSQEQARRDSKPPTVLVLPGSRGGEMRRMLPVFGAAVHLAAKTAPLDVVLPTVPHLVRRISEATAGWQIRPRIVVDQEEKWAAFRVARAALAASGTVTLELAVAGVPAIVAYKISLLEEVVARLMIWTPTIVLANLVLGENIMPEFLQRAATPEKLAAELTSILEPTAARQRQLAAFAKFDTVMGIGREAPATLAAEIVLQALDRPTSR